MKTLRSRLGASLHTKWDKGKEAWLGPYTFSLFSLYIYDFLGNRYLQVGMETGEGLKSESMGHKKPLPYFLLLFSQIRLKVTFPDEDCLKSQENID